MILKILAGLKKSLGPILKAATGPDQTADYLFFTHAPILLYFFMGQ